MSNVPAAKPWTLRVSFIAGVLALLTIVALVVAGPGYSKNLIELGTAFTLTQLAAGLAVFALVAGLIALIMGRTGQPKIWTRGAIAGIVIGAFVVVQLAMWVQKARSVPPIHDITTDVDDPPQFVAVAPLRADAANPAEYAGPETAEQQLGAYPDIGTLEIAALPEQVIAAAETIARDSGWDIVAAVPDEGRLEATDTTFWYGYKDDIVVRATSEGSISTVDVRSKSRVGRSDLGTNAERIREFTAALKAAFGE